MSIARKTALPALVALTVALASGAASAQTPCAKWEVYGRWTAIQGNHRVDFHLNQQGTSVYGIGSYAEIKSPLTFGSFSARTEERVTGTVRGNAVELQTAWGGVYIGTIDATGRIDGYTYDRRDSTSNARWFSNRRMACTAQAQAPAPTPAATPPAPRPAPVSQGSGTVPSSRNSGVGSVFRTGAAPTPVPVPTPAFSEGRSIYCKSGFVWRVARPSDLVCVTPRSRDRVALENATAAQRAQPGGGAYGPNTCRSGFVWREAFVGDLVCVRPTIRELVAKENGLAATRVN